MQQMVRRVDVHRQRVAEVRVEIRQPGAIDDQVQRPPQALPRFHRQSEPGFARIACHHLYPLAQEIREPVAVPLGQPVENG